MIKQKVLYQGAEALICLDTYLHKTVIQKKRISKQYRIREIDHRLIGSRTKEEAKLFSLARSCGVPVPLIYDVDIVNGILIMEYIQGKRIKDLLHHISLQERKKICTSIGRNIARLHNHHIIHGDITTSNMILFDDRIYFIDFGLGCISQDIELKGVDLHVLMEAFESTHSQYPECFSYVLEGYQMEYTGDAKAVIMKIDEIVQRGRYR
ncbi:MAG: KEOPS complex kinase/ATPase Bud32 [Candidatus Thermoplasmatota archaeon]